MNTEQSKIETAAATETAPADTMARLKYYESRCNDMRLALLKIQDITKEFNLEPKDYSRSFTVDKNLIEEVAEVVVEEEEQQRYFMPINYCRTCGKMPEIENCTVKATKTVCVSCGGENCFKSVKNYSKARQKEEATRQAIEEWNIRNNHKAPPCPLPKLNRCAVCGREPKTLTSLYPGDYSGNKRDISIFCTGHCAVVKFCDIYTSEAAKAAAQRQAVEEWNIRNDINPLV